MPNPIEIIASQLGSEQRAILACTAIGVNHVAVGFTDRAVQLMVIRGLIEHKGRYVLTETGRAVIEVLIERGRTEWRRRHWSGKWRRPCVARRLRQYHLQGREMPMPANLKSGRGLAALVCVAVGQMACGASAVTVEAAKKCEELAFKAYPSREPGNPAAGLAKGTAQDADRYYRECLDKGGNVDARPTSPTQSDVPR